MFLIAIKTKNKMWKINHVVSCEVETNEDEVCIKISHEDEENIFLKGYTHIYFNESEKGYGFRKILSKEEKLEQEKREKNIFNQKISRFIDSKAQELQYDNMMSCTKYVGYDNPYRQECEDLLKWNARVWEFVSQSEETDAYKLIEQLKEI
jgi:galactose mutarotase-like enzyme